MTQKMTPEEDAELRRLHYFERFGCELAPPVRAVKGSLRARDKRAAVREPTDAAVIAPDTGVRVTNEVVVPRPPR